MTKAKEMKTKHLNRVKEVDLDMNDRVYAMRRKVINIIYHVKTFYPDMPRIEVRIVQNNDLILGQASHEAFHISIMERCIDKPYFAEVVYHELVHTCFKFGHDESCRLMKSQINPKDRTLSQDELDNLFKRYLSKFKEARV
jgi:hypothetical protein